ncbi:unnamed protein product, partial [Allacma fusca]
ELIYTNKNLLLRTQKIQEQTNIPSYAVPAKFTKHLTLLYQRQTNMRPQKTPTKLQRT